MIVAVEAAWHRVTRNIDIGPTVVVKIRCAHAKAVRARGNPLFTRESGRRRAARNRNTGSLGNILKRSIAVIVVQNVCSTTESLRSTADKQAKILDRKSTRLNSSHGYISYAVFCLKKKNKNVVQ